ncbi:MAG: family transcriptional regulator, cyclic receptor protein [Frankiales bacterium]|jgi:CRP-like cAMP-binding protein|nr:family transcriptional regulator, cyclic receptor protein [Frankiales bacterium]
MKQRYEDYLRPVPMFSACTPKELSHVAQLVERLEVKKGDDLVKEGTRTREFFVLMEGHADVTRRGQVLATLGPYMHFGELALLDPAPRNATVTMTTDGQVLVLTQQSFFTLVHDVPGLVKALLTGLAQRVHSLDPSPVN